jgi:hypothetical protein
MTLPPPSVPSFCYSSCRRRRSTPPPAAVIVLATSEHASRAGWLTLSLSLSFSLSMCYGWQVTESQKTLSKHCTIYFVASNGVIITHCEKKCNNTSLCEIHIWPLSQSEQAVGQISSLFLSRNTETLMYHLLPIAVIGASA